MDKDDDDGEDWEIEQREGTESFSEEGQGEGELKEVQKKDEYIGKKEWKRILQSKFVLYTLLAVSAAAAGTFAYLFSSSNEANHFENDVSGALFFFCEC